MQPCLVKKVYDILLLLCHNILRSSSSFCTIQLTHKFQAECLNFQNRFCIYVPISREFPKVILTFFRAGVNMLVTNSLECYW